MPSPASLLRGIGTGCLFLTLFGALWMLIALDAQPFLWIAMCVLLPASLLVLRSLGVLRSGRKLGEGRAVSAEEAAAAHARGRRFAVVVLVEFGSMAVAANLLAAYHLSAWILLAVAAIVGLHFFPLARLFGNSIYYWTGGMELAACAALAWLARAHPVQVDPILGLMMGISLWTTAVYMLLQANVITVRYAE